MAKPHTPAKRKQQKTTPKQAAPFQPEPGTNVSTPSQKRSNPTSKRPSKKRSPSTWLWLGGGALVLIVLAPFILRQLATSSIAGVQTFGSPARVHTEAPQTYPQTPPVGGPHSLSWQNCGVYDQPIANEHGVHSLEHGAVWVTYHPDLAEEGVARLRDVVGRRSYTLLSPYPDLPAPVVVSAWGVQLRLEDPSDPRLTQFMATYQQGPQTPEPGAPCSGGVSTTVG